MNKIYFRVALQSGLAAGLSLGLPAGLLFWLILFHHTNPTMIVEGAVTFLQAHALNKIIVLILFSLLWSFLLGRISGYKKWTHIALATILGIFAGWYSPLSNLDGLLEGKYPIHILYAITISGLIFSVTSFVGVAYGFILRNVKAALVIGFSTSFVSVLTFVLIFILFEQFGIRVGVAPLAMSKITASGLMASAITGGSMLGVGFSWFVKK